MDAPLMLTTPGITQKEYALDPLGTEAELTPGPSDANPFRSPEERAVVEASVEKDRQQRAAPTVDRAEPDAIHLPFDTAYDDPTAGRDPYAFDDVAPTLETSYPLPDHDGPMF